MAIILAFVLGFGICFVVKAANEPTTDSASHTMTGNASEDTTAMESAMAEMATNLAGKTADELDRAFLENMIVHHEGAIEMAQIIVNTTKRPELKEVAENIINAQRTEVTTMKSWLTAWYGL